MTAMLSFVRYSPADIAFLNLQPAQAQWREHFMNADHARALDVPNMAWTGLLADGHPVACGGIVPQWEGRSTVWAMFGQDIPICAWPRLKRKLNLEVEKELARQKAACGHARVEMTVAKGFGPGCRLAFLLGFEVEGLMKKYAPSGDDHYLFAREA